MPLLSLAAVTTSLRAPKHVWGQPTGSGFTALSACVVTPLARAYSAVAAVAWAAFIRSLKCGVANDATSSSVARPVHSADTVANHLDRFRPSRWSLHRL